MESSEAAFQELARLGRAGKETNFNGTLFRSRLEADWARYFDELGYTWEYERESLRVPGLYYQPDFIVWDHFGIAQAIEIKPFASGIGPELKKPEEWAKKNPLGLSLAIFIGRPKEHFILLCTPKRCIPFNAHGGELKRAVI